MAINTIKDLIAYLESGHAYGQAVRLDLDELLLLKELLKGLSNVVRDEATFRSKVGERLP